ncbi:MAG: hypothetical protein ACJ8EY_01310 [Sphingomicrobium sp.]
MSASPEEEPSEPEYSEASVSAVQAVAEQLVALVEEFEAQLSEGRVPPAFEERLSRLRESAEGLI